MNILSNHKAILTLIYSPLSFASLYQVHTVKCEDKGHWSEPMRRCKSRLAGVCPVPVPPPGVIITCEDHFPGGICKVQCKDSFHDVVEEVGCYYGYVQHETSVFPRFFCRSKLTALNVAVRICFPRVALLDSRSRLSRGGRFLASPLIALLESGLSGPPCILTRVKRLRSSCPTSIHI